MGLGNNCAWKECTRHSLRGDSLFALRVEVDTLDLALLLVKADVIKPLEAGAVDGLDLVVGDQEVFLPAHEDVLALRRVAHGDAEVTRDCGRRR